MKLVLGELDSHAFFDCIYNLDLVLFLTNASLGMLMQSGWWVCN